MELKEAIRGIRKAMDLKLGSWGLKNRTVTCRRRDSHSERGVVQCQKHGILKARQPGFEHCHCHQSHLTLWCLGFLIFHIGSRAAWSWWVFHHVTLQRAYGWNGMKKGPIHPLHREGLDLWWSSPWPSLPMGSASVCLHSLMHTSRTPHRQRKTARPTPTVFCQWAMNKPYTERSIFFFLQFNWSYLEK